MQILTHIHTCQTCHANTRLQDGTCLTYPMRIPETTHINIGMVRSLCTTQLYKTRNNIHIQQHRI